MGLFDGMGSLSVGVFGAQVEVIPVSGVARNVRATFREQPEELVGRDGDVTITVLPTLSAVAATVSDLGSGATVNPGKGKIYRYVAPMSSGSPASDALIKIQLERI